MKAYEDLKEILEDQIKKISKKGDISVQELDNAYKAVDILKDMETIKAMQEAGYSQDSGNSYRNSYNSYDGGYSGNNSNNSYGPIWNQNQDMMRPYPMRRMSRDGMSNDGSYNSYGGSYNRSYDNSHNSYEGSYNSYDGRAGRDADSDGRYSERGGSYEYSNDYSRRRYSRHSEKERMIDKLETMADVASDTKTKMAIEQCITKLEG